MGPHIPNVDSEWRCPGRCTAGKKPRYPWRGRFDGPQSQFGHFGEEKKLYPLPGFEPWIVQLVRQLLYLLCYPDFLQMTELISNKSRLVCTVVVQRLTACGTVRGMQEYAPLPQPCISYPHLQAVSIKVTIPYSFHRSFYLCCLVPCRNNPTLPFRFVCQVPLFSWRVRCISDVAI